MPTTRFRRQCFRLTFGPQFGLFDKAGHELSSHVIYETVMGDMGRYTSNAVTIWPDRMITFTDSTVTRQINAEGDDEIPGTDSLIVTKRNYEITDAGTIKKID